GVTTVHSGDYFATATLNGCSLTDTLTVVVKPLPDKPVAASNTPLCAGEALSLTASSSTSGVTYSWTGPGSFTSTIQNPVIGNTTTASTGDYIVTATLNGCVSRDTAAVNVKP